MSERDPYELTAGLSKGFDSYKTRAGEEASGLVILHRQACLDYDSYRYIAIASPLPAVVDASLGVNPARHLLVTAIGPWAPARSYFFMVDEYTAPAYVIEKLGQRVEPRHWPALVYTVRSVVGDPIWERENGFDWESNHAHDLEG